MIHGIVHVQEIDFLHIGSVDLYPLQYHVNHVKSLVLDIVFVIENSNSIELHHLQDTLNYIKHEETLHLLKIILSRVVAIVLFLYPTVEVDSTLEITL